MAIDEPQRIGPRGRVNLTAALRGLRVGETVVFAQPVNLGSLRTLSRAIGIRIALKTLDDGSIQITRRPHKEEATGSTKANSPPLREASPLRNNASREVAAKLYDL